MARKAREKSSTGDYAVTLKCVEEIFKSKKVKAMFIECAQQYLGEGLKGIRASNAQAEMLIHESEKGISMDMKPLMTSFARAYNREFENEGKIFADRFKSVPVEEAEDYENCIKYLDNGKSSSLFNGEKKKPSATAKQTVEKETNTKTEGKPAKKKTVKKETVKKTAAEKTEKKSANTAKTEKKVTVKQAKKTEKPVVTEEKLPTAEKKEEKPKPKRTICRYGCCNSEFVISFRFLNRK